MAEFKTYDKCPTCGADAWKSTKHCPFCGTLLRYEDDSSAFPETDASEQFHHNEYAFRSELAPSENEKVTFEEPEKPKLDSNSAFLNTRTASPEVSVNVSTDEPANVADAASVLNANQNSPAVNPTAVLPLEIVSKANPSTTIITIGEVVFLILWCVIGFNVISFIGSAGGGFTLFPIAVLLLGVWGVVRGIRENSNSKKLISSGREYDAVVLEYDKSTSMSRSGRSIGTTRTYGSRSRTRKITHYKIRVRAFIEGRETNILIPVENLNAQMAHPVGSRVKIVGQGDYWIIK